MSPALIMLSPVAAADLAVGEGGSEHIFGAHGAGDDVGTGIRNDGGNAVLARDFDHRHGDAGMNGADQDIRLLTLDEFCRQFGRLGRGGFVIDLYERNVAARKLAALQISIELEAAHDRLAQRRIGAAERQQHADLEGARLRIGRADVRPERTGSAG